MSKNCKDCVFYVPPKEGYTCGSCEYPVPAWLRIGVSGGGFLNGSEAGNCQTYKTRAEVVESAKEQ